MKNWKLYKLGDISSIHNGSTPSTKNKDYWDGDIIWITPKDLSDQKLKYVLKGERCITDEGLSKVKSNLLPEGTLLLSSRAPIGLIAIAKNKLVTNQGFKNIVVDNTILSNEFLYYTLKLRKKELEKLGSGTTFKELSKKSLESFNIFIPNLESQKAIAKVLSDLDAKIELNNKINKELEAMAKTLYDYWFVQFDFPNDEGKPYKSSGGKMVYNEDLKREIPAGWNVGKLSDFVDIVRGVSYKSDELNINGKPMVNLNSFFLDGSYKVDGIKYFSGDYNKNKLLKSNDLLIAVTDVTRNADIIGKSFILPNIFNDDVLFSMDIAKITPDNNLSIHYLNMLFNSQPYHDFIKQFASGTLVLHLDLRAFDFFNVIIPNKDLLEKFSKLKEKIEKKKSVIIKENQQLSELRDWLLPMLMNGQVATQGITNDK